MSSEDETGRRGDRPARARYGFAAAAVAFLGAFLLGACGSGTTLTVPVLWAASQPGGTLAGGVEKATVEVDQIGDPGFTLNLEDIEAEGAGSQWKAASSAAAAVGTLLSGTDPNEVDVRFGVTGPIDGPSGGAILTVGVLAAIRDEQLRPRVTMTGTINPDGSIGPVTNVTTKVRAAARDGYETVLIPRGTEVEYDPVSGSTVDNRELGRSLGVDVRVVANLGSAYRAFTGKNIAPGSGSPPVPGNAVKKVARETTESLTRRIAREIRIASPGVISDSTRDQWQAAARASAAGDLPLTYALGVDALKAVRRDYLRAQVTDRLESGGTQTAVKGLLARIVDLRAKAATVIVRSTKRAGTLGFEQQLLTPVATGWITYSVALMDVVEARLRRNRSPGRAALVGMAKVIADSEASIEVFGPDAVKAALVSGPVPGQGATDVSSLSDPPGREETASFLSGYSNFLVRGGRASEQYFEEVVQVAGLGGINPYTYPAFRALGRSADRIPPGTDPLGREMVQASTAISFFVLGAILVSGDSILGLGDFGVGGDVSSDGGPELLASTVAGATSTVDYWSSALQARGLDMGYPVWSNEWGRAGFEALRGTGRAPAGAVLALEEAWYTAIGCFMLGGITGT